MTALSETADHARLMDGVYRRQRHFYDATRKFYLLGRDRLVERLDAPRGGAVLELGCGTGRNIIHAIERYPTTRFFGLDISAEMLRTAGRRMLRERTGDRVALDLGDASAFDTSTLFDRTSFDRVYISYALSMIPPWRETIRSALSVLEPGGSLHIVDFGSQEDLPRLFRAGLRAWLARFHVSPRDSLREVLESESKRIDASLEFETLYRGYAVHAIVRLPR